MAVKTIHVDGVGELPFYKRKGTSSVKIRISGSEVKVSLPNWMPYKAAVLYVSQKADWINSHRKQSVSIGNGSKIGNRTVFIRVATGSRFSSSITDTTLIARIPASASTEDAAIQKKLFTLAQKALQTDGEEYIIPRVRTLASQHSFEVGKIEIKNLKSRWGHCSSNKDLAFSLFLTQLPQNCIDYVIYHELAHTVHMNHGTDFWNLVQSLCPNYKLIRKQMKQYSPQVIVH
jgi:predicted metal-dependent hydrolase